MHHEGSIRQPSAARETRWKSTLLCCQGQPRDLAQGSRPVIHEEAGLVKVTDCARLGAWPLAAARAVTETLQSSIRPRGAGQSAVRGSGAQSSGAAVLLRGRPDFHASSPEQREEGSGARGTFKWSTGADVAVSHAVTTAVIVPHGGAGGVIIAQGGAFAGWSLYAKEGKPTYCYNLLGLQRFKVSGNSPIPAGDHQISMEFAYD